MSSTMKAYQFTTPSQGLQLTTLPIPSPGPTQLLIRIKAAGICHTDHNLISGNDDTFLFKRPITLGHEIAGIITKKGTSTTSTFSINDPVVALVDTKCPFTLGGVSTGPGLGIDGGFAEYVVIEESKTLPIPPGISFASAAIATDAMATAYHALMTHGQITSRSTVAIIGLGGLGMSGAQLAAKIIQAQVYGIEPDTRKYASALSLGVSACAKSFAGFPGKKFDVVVDFAGMGSTTSEAVMAVKQGGTIVLVGLGRKECTLNTYEFVANNVVLKGSTGADKEEVEACMRLLAEKRLEAVVEEIPFEGIVDGIERLARGDVVGRLWADPSKR